MKRIILLVLVMTAAAAAQDPFPLSSHIRMELKGLSLEKNGDDLAGHVFKPGQTLWINLSVLGLKRNGGDTVTFQSDLKLSRENGETVLEEKNILNMKLTAPAGRRFKVTANYHIELLPDIKAGPYKVDIVLRDMTAMKSGKLQAAFTVVKE